MADALLLPFADGTFDGFVAGFGVRNFADPARGMREICRTLKPGARGTVLEFFTPEHSVFGRIYALLITSWIPAAGGLLTGSFSAYRHLSTTIRGFSTRADFAKLARTAGFEVTGSDEYAGGAATAFFLKKL